MKILDLINQLKKFDKNTEVGIEIKDYDSEKIFFFDTAFGFVYEIDLDSGITTLSLRTKTTEDVIKEILEIEAADDNNG